MARHHTRQAVVMGVVLRCSDAPICKPDRGLALSGCCGEVGQKGAHSFLADPADMQRCDDCR